MDNTTNNTSIGIAFYYKLWKCLNKALSDDKLGCHANSIIIHLGRNIESQNEYYNEPFNQWCDYFLSVNNTKEKALSADGFQQGGLSEPCRENEVV